MKRITEKSEIERLNEIYKDLPPNQYEVAQGLIIQAARLRVRLEALWRNIKSMEKSKCFRNQKRQIRMSANARRHGFSHQLTKTIRQSSNSLMR